MNLRRNNFKVATIVWLLCLGAAFAAPSNDFKAANQLYDAGKFAEAAAAYGKIEPKTAPVYYNLGNTQYRMGAAAKDLDGLQETWETAIKSYERAASLNTNDVDAAFNLAFTKNGVEQIKAFREAMRRARADAAAAVRQRNYHRAVEIMDALMQNKIAAKQFEEFTKKLKDIDAIATPHQP